MPILSKKSMAMPVNSSTIFPAQELVVARNI